VFGSSRYYSSNPTRQPVRAMKMWPDK